MGIQPQGDAIRKAVKWISEARQTDSPKALGSLINQASVRFNLSPKETAFLERTLAELPPKATP